MIQICSTPQEAVDVNNGGHWRGRFRAASPPPPPPFPNANAANAANGGNFLVSVSFLQQQECPVRESSSTSSPPPLPPLLPILNLPEDQEQPPAGWKRDSNNRIQLRPRFRHDGSTSDALLQDLLARSAGIQMFVAPPAPLLQTAMMTYEDEPAADQSFWVEEEEEEESEPMPSPNAISDGLKGVVVDAPLLPRYSSPSTPTPRLRLKSHNPIVRASFPELIQMERTTTAT